MSEEPLTQENARDEICRVDVQLSHHQIDWKYSILYAFPLAPVPIEMLQQDSRLRILGYFKCDNTAPNGLLSVYDMARSAGLDKVRLGVLVLRKRGFSIEPCNDYQI